MGHTFWSVHVRPHAQVHTCAHSNTPGAHPSPTPYLASLLTAPSPQGLRTLRSPLGQTGTMGQRQAWVQSFEFSGRRSSSVWSGCRLGLLVSPQGLGPVRSLSA